MLTEARYIGERGVNTIESCICDAFVSIFQRVTIAVSGALGPITVFFFISVFALKTSLTFALICVPSYVADTVILTRVYFTCVIRHLSLQNTVACYVAQRWLDFDLLRKFSLKKVNNFGHRVSVTQAHILDDSFEELFFLLILRKLLMQLTGKDFLCQVHYCMPRLAK